ncbi:MAG: multi-sensor signal transduction histidine kinase [Parcubacteria group bacterium Greene0714_4]|nr:MAG: multi-sensor signal transduction histidine kinase [Parcubacteria group bacterium Greene1014_15]TSD06594.1 MAG: multi-sensor signal transduction histidine kinase [Parcubacteria group bacterium Greene0714_4]
MNKVFADSQHALIMEALIENLPAGVALVDREKKIILANKAMMQLTRLPREGFYLTELTKLFNVDLGTELDKILSTSISPMVILSNVVLRDFFYFIYCFQICDDAKNVIGGAILLQDITKSKAIEREKSEFMSMASHQLRTPLGSMRWNLELLEEDIRSLPEISQKRFYEAYIGNRRAIWLVADLLNVSRIEQGKAEGEPQLTDLVSIIRNITEEMASEAESRKIALEFKLINEAIPKIVIDPAQFRDVIENLLSNALKYTKSGGRITIMLDHTNGYVEITVADTGIGIPAADQYKIFSKFFRSKNAVRIYTESSGLGLFIVRSYVEKWGGTIRFESTEGQGTTFYVTIPVTSNITV